MTKMFSLNVLTNGLWGQPFAIGAIVHSTGAEVQLCFYGRCPIEEPVDDEIRDIVLPEIEALRVDYGSYKEMLAAFADFYLKFKDGADVIAFMPVTAASFLLRDMHIRYLIGSSDLPVPFIDISGCLKQAGENPLSLDLYATKYGISVDPTNYSGGIFNPLYDCAQAIAVYEHLQGRVPKAA